MSSNLHLTQSTHPMDAEGIVRCAHGEQAVKRTSKTSNNFNRDFYTCSRVNNNEKCKFFYWADDPIFPKENVATRMPPPAPPPSMRSFPPRQGTATPVTPQRSPSKRLADIEAALNTPSPSQRRGTAASTTPQRSPSKRLADIEASLNSQGPSASRNSHHNEAPANDRTHSFLFGSSTQSSEASTDMDWDDILPTASPDDSPTSLSYPLPGSSDFRTPKKPRLSPIEPSSSIQAPRFLPMTPPQTVHRRTSTGSSQHSLPTGFPITPIRAKGKERENPRLEQCSEDEPAVQSGAVVPGPPTNGANAIRHASPNPFLDDDTVAERISSHLDALSVLQASSYIRKLERKYNALNLSNETKVRYIEHLTAANAELENNVAQLEQQNAELQMRLQRCEQSITRAPLSSTRTQF